MITDLRLQNFRIYEDSTFELGKGVNIIVGPNGSGKTSLLEAVQIVCSGKSYRGSDQDLTMHEKEWSRIDGHSEKEARVIKYQLSESGYIKDYEIGSDKLKRLMHPRRIPVVIFEPTHLQLLTGSPQKRRDFLDDIIEQADAGYEKIRRDYKRILAQRNTLLKGSPTEQQLFIWDIRLSELGAHINKARNSFIKEHSTALQKLYERISTKKDMFHIEISQTVLGDDYSGSMLKALKNNIHKDTLRGFTHVGPHRDDVVPFLRGHELSKAGSRGEVRTALLALKLLELQAIEKSLGVKPILLLDDVFSELDGSRRRSLTDYLQDHQTFITTTDADVVVQHFITDCHIIPVG
jgi:DNA replication and repair protein RecF